MKDKMTKMYAVERLDTDDAYLTLCVTQNEEQSNDLRDLLNEEDGDCDNHRVQEIYCLHDDFKAWTKVDVWHERAEFCDNGIIKNRQVRMSSIWPWDIYQRFMIDNKVLQVNRPKGCKYRVITTTCNTPMEAKIEMEVLLDCCAKSDEYGMAEIVPIEHHKLGLNIAKME